VYCCEKVEDIKRGERGGGGGDVQPSLAALADLSGQGPPTWCCLLLYQ
jgi:hypothetical protein